MDPRVLDLIDTELALLVRRATSLSNDKSFANLDRSAYLLLNHMIASGPTGVRALADEFRLDISTVSRQIAALEQKGYVLRSPNPDDGRAYFFEVTESGRAEHAEYKKMRQARITEKMQGWSDEERRTFGDLLRKFNRTLNQ
ncbi:MarR family winged helix-turn-helix transcriptional regulator [Cohnella thermotolerans]|jgi:DNA-binding MarR family transcriptional regulator|uniref:MarR family winged helix-turn-helix transcriptional regulator n=1 Tax=Cohnella thermotolerans TaxID=329858 RepID=UPI0003FC74F0|nr:MarR family transcriptional regulator [Cohnella thermotolerans]